MLKALPKFSSVLYFVMDLYFPCGRFSFSVFLTSVLYCLLPECIRVFLSMISQQSQVNTTNGFTAACQHEEKMHFYDLVIVPCYMLYDVV